MVDRLPVFIRAATHDIDDAEENLGELSPHLLRKMTSRSKLISDKGKIKHDWSSCDLKIHHKSLNSPAESQINSRSE